MTINQLRHVADVRVSNVDKKSVDGQAHVRLVNYVDVYYNDEIDSGMEFMSATATAEQVRSFKVLAGDSIITKDSETAADIAVPAFISSAEQDMVCGYHLAMLRPRPALIDPKFLFWCLKSSALRDQMAVRANGVTRFGLTYEAILGATVRLGPLSEQRRIADFLDDQVARVDNIVAAREKQRELIEESRSAELNAAIEHVAVDRVRLARFARVQTGVTVDAGRAIVDPVELPYLRVANVQAGGLMLDEVKTIRLERSQVQRSLLRDGDVLMTEGGDVDKLGRGTVWRSQIPGQVVHQNHVFAVRVDREYLVPEFLTYVTAARAAREYFELTATKTTNLASTSSSKVLSLTVPYVDTLLQATVVSRIDSATSQLADLDMALGESIGKLNELKRSLITAAVTGAFDVTTADGSRVQV